MSKYDTFAAHNWGKDKRNHENVLAIVHQLQALGAKVWIDEKEMEGRVINTMFQGIDDSSTVTVFITEEYIHKVAGKGRNGADDNCLMEFDYSKAHKGIDMMIPVVMEAAMDDRAKWRGTAGVFISRMRIRGWDRPAEDVARDIATILAKRVSGFQASHSKEYMKILGVSQNKESTTDM